MINFSNDYSKGAHPLILQALLDTNEEAFPGYGTDPYTKSATEKIRGICKCPEADVYFLTGGTQTNATVISTMLNQYEGVVSASTGHIGVHEAGAVEYTGHKVLPLKEYDGKMRSEDLNKYLDDFSNDMNHEHMVFPGMVYISHPTEYGTLYSAKELDDIYSVCKNHDIPLFIDGARLGYGLMSDNTDVSIEYLSHHCDVFYFGGTKVGALFGEAVVFTHNNAPKHFYTMTKQHGAMLAKGWLTGLQFDTLFTDDLYFKISKHAIDCAKELKEIIKKHDIPVYLLTDTNQQFVIISEEMYDKLTEKVAVSFWERTDDKRIIIRLATSWYTKASDLEKLDGILEDLMKK